MCMFINVGSYCSITLELVSSKASGNEAEKLKDILALEIEIA